MRANILTVAACSNDGPSFGSVRNSAPWLLTVGASKSDKSFVTTVKIGHEEFKGSSLTLLETEWLPLIEFPSLSVEIALRGLLSPSAVSENRKKLEELEGKIVLCEDGDKVNFARSYAKGILYKTGDLEPYAKVGRGPNLIMDILKPDLCAPGVEIPVPFQELKNPQEVNGPFSFDRLKSAFARGAGFMDFIRAKDPGLVYDCGEDAFASSLLGQGADLIEAGESFIPFFSNSCLIIAALPATSGHDLNRFALRVSRTLKNVDTSNCDYEGKIEEQALGVEIEIEPSKLHFEGLNSEQQFTLIFRIDTKLWKLRPSFVTYLAWTNKDHSVRSLIVIVKQETLDYLVDEDSADATISLN
nr:subtilisin-like protease sbt4.9 [Quercus suber]